VHHPVQQNLPLFDFTVKSTYSFLTVPETCVPTFTSVTGLIVPLRKPFDGYRLFNGLQMILLLGRYFVELPVSNIARRNQADAISNRQAGVQYFFMASLSLKPSLIAQSRKAQSREEVQRVTADLFITDLLIVYLL